MKKYLTMAGGAVTVIAVFLPFTSVMGVTVNGMKMGGAAWFYIVCGIAAVITGYVDKRKFYTAVIITGLLIAGLAMKYQSDLKSLGGASVEMGLWVLLLGGLLTMSGGIMGVLAKKRYVNRVA